MVPEKPASHTHVNDPTCGVQAPCRPHGVDTQRSVAQTRSDVAVGELTTNCDALQTVNVEHRRLLVDVGAAVSYSSLVHDDTLAQPLSVVALGAVSWY